MYNHSLAQTCFKTAGFFQSEWEPLTHCQELGKTHSTIYNTMILKCKNVGIHNRRCPKAKNVFTGHYRKLIYLYSSLFKTQPCQKILM